MDKCRELYSREGHKFSRFEGNTVTWEHIISKLNTSLEEQSFDLNLSIEHIH